MGAVFNKFIDNSQFSDDTVGVALLQAAEQFKTQASLLAPFDYGNLARSIDYLPDKKDYLVGTNVEYAAHQEFGTKYMKSQPFMRPTAYAMKNKNIDLDDFNKFLRTVDKT